MSREKISNYEVSNVIPETVSDFIKDRKQLEQEVKNSYLIDPFVKFLEQNYGKEQVVKVMGTDSEKFLLEKIKKIDTKDIITVANTFIPWLKDAHTIFTTMSNVLWWDDMNVLVEEYVNLWKDHDVWQVAEWMKWKGIAINAQSSIPTVIKENSWTVNNNDVLNNDNVADNIVQSEQKLSDNTNIIDVLNQNSIETKWYLKNIKQIQYNGNIILETVSSTPYIHKDALEDIVWFALEFYQKTGKPLTLNSSYRTVSNQQWLYNKYKSGKWNLAAKPGQSWHNLWLSIDIHSEDRYAWELGWIEWLRLLAKKYNFYPFDKEDWHFDHKKFVDMKTKKDVDRIALSKKIEKKYSSVV